MLFNSYIFIFIFLPVCLLGFYALTRLNNDIYAKLWLIGFSLWFYGYFNLYYLAIMVISILLNYGLFVWIIREKAENKGKIGTDIKVRLPFAAGIIINLGILFYFKYFDFFISNINSFFKTDIPLKNILLPLGISFFTFQQVGFLVDAYRDEITDVTFIDYALFVSFFPQLIAGPIVSQGEMLPQFKQVKGRRPDSEMMARGLSLFIMGLFKKVYVADTLGTAVDAGYQSLAGMGGLDCFLIMIWYTLQLYFDFSGYCDMARGIAEMFGFELPVNFDSPYKASDIIEFWKKWHITLTRFFTKYVYIPLGGNRKGEARMLINILIVYFLSGLWHGAGYNYILWGMLHGVLYVATRAWYIHRPHKEPGRIRSAVGKTFTFIYVSFAWVFFRAETIPQAVTLIKGVFTGSWSGVSRTLSDPFKLSELWYAIKVLHLDNRAFSQNLLMWLFTAAVLAVTFLAPNAGKTAEKLRPRIGTAVIMAILGIWSVLCLSEVSTFLYFNF